MKSFSHYHFTGQKPQETIILVIHRHWFDILSQFLVIFLMIFIFLGSIAFIPVFFPDFNNGPTRNLFLFLENSFFLFIWITFFLIWIDYYFDVWIITNERIVNIEQKGLFSRVISELELEKIQDITSDVAGVIPTFLNYGDLYIQTAAERERFLFNNIPNPYGVKDLIMRLQKKQETKEENQFGELISKKIHKDFS